MKATYIFKNLIYIINERLFIMKNKMIATVLKEYRNKNNYTVSEVARILSDEKSMQFAEKTIYGWESGHAQPDADTLLTLCDIYNIKDILGTFGYKTGHPFNLTRREQDLIIRYRNRPKLQRAVDKLLDLEPEKFD